MRIWITGFPRGGTTWLRNCLGTHPAIDAIPEELVLWKHHETAAAIDQAVTEVRATYDLTAPHLVEKSPANAKWLPQALAMCPEDRFLFVIRDPRDVLVSHQRSTRSWTNGRNSTVAGCMGKLARYVAGYEAARPHPHLRLHRYEDLHQHFEATLQALLAWLAVENTPAIRQTIYDQNQFVAVTGREYTEDRDAAARRGVMGEWSEQLTAAECAWYRQAPFWTDFFATHDYTWEPVVVQPPAPYEELAYDVE